MGNLRLNIGFLVLFLSSSLSAQASIVDLKFNDEGKFVKNIEIAPRKAIEVCGNLTKDAILAWSFKSDLALKFNIHYHQGKEVTYLVNEAKIMSMQQPLTILITQDYCWMWSNRGQQPAQLTISIDKSV